MSHERRLVSWLALGLLVTGILLGSWLARDAHHNVHLPKSIDLLTATAQDLSQLLSTQVVSSEQLLEEYDRRVHLDNTKGLCLRAILSLTPKSITLATARARDNERRNGFIRSPLHGIPVSIKGNMATGPDLNMTTSFGAYAFENATADRDAFFVAKAQEAGMIIMGKANLGELKGFRDQTISPGWSSLGGETISPYDGKHPCGSSGGSAVAVAAGFAPLTFGSETQGSISCPASFTALYALKPSTGLISRSGVLPSSTTFDAPGMFAKSAWDLAALLTAVSGPDPEDPVTIHAVPYALDDYTADLRSEWRDWRLGIADRKWFWSLYDDEPDNPDMRKMFDHGFRTVARMRDLGATVVDDVKIPSAYRAAGEAPALMGRIIRHEMRAGLGKAFRSLKNTTVKSLEDLVQFNHEYAERAFSKDNPGQSYLEWALYQQSTETEYQTDLKQAHLWGVEEGITYALERHNLDAVIVPGWSEMSIYAAWAKAPTATVPLGVYGHGKPYGLGFVAKRFEDEKLLKIMALYERTFPPRLVPELIRRSKKKVAR